jgi:hypothetical protein
MSGNITLNTSPGEVKLTSDFLDYRFRPVDTVFKLMNMWEFREDLTKVLKKMLSGGSLGEGDALEMDEDGDQPREHARRWSHCFSFSSDEHPEFDTHAPLDVILIVSFLSYLGTTFLGRTSIKKHSAG